MDRSDELAAINAYLAAREPTKSAYSAKPFRFLGTPAQFRAMKARIRREAAAPRKPARVHAWSTSPIGR
jgi:hypothetical protein